MVNTNSKFNINPRKIQNTASTTGTMVTQAKLQLIYSKFNTEISQLSCKILLRTLIFELGI